MHVIHKFDGMHRELIAAFDLVERRIVFDENRGAPEFVAALKVRGVAGRIENGTVVRVMPEPDGTAFLDACLKCFAGYPVACNDEEMLTAAEQEFGFREHARVTADDPTASR